jgi:hypothetical protein
MWQQICLECSEGLATYNILTRAGCAVSLAAAVFRRRMETRQASSVEVDVKLGRVSEDVRLEKVG